MHYKNGRNGKPYRKNRQMDYGILAAVAVGIPLGSLITVFAPEIHALMNAAAQSANMPSMMIGMAGGLSFYLWRVTEGAPFKCTLALLHTALGSFFGVIGAKAAGGFGGNEQLQVVAAGIGGGMGPRAIDRIEKMVRTR